MAVVRILGIDPGTQCVGFACLETVVASGRRAGGVVPLALRASNVQSVDVQSGDVRILDFGVMRLGTRKTPLSERLFALTDKYLANNPRLAPLGTNVKTAVVARLQDKAPERFVFLDD